MLGQALGILPSTWSWRGPLQAVGCARDSAQLCSAIMSPAIFVSFFYPWTHVSLTLSVNQMTRWWTRTTSHMKEWRGSTPQHVKTFEWESPRIWMPIERANNIFLSLHIRPDHAITCQGMLVHHTHEHKRRENNWTRHGNIEKVHSYALNGTVG